MIPKVTKGSSMTRLLRYLFGPGHHDEHTNQHVVAGYESPAVMEPPREGDSVDVGELAADLTAPMSIAKGAGRKIPDQTVWHCSLSLDPSEGQLSDERWREIAEAFMGEMGFADCRWVAVRHGLSKGSKEHAANGNDHIHIATTRFDESGKRVSWHLDYPRAQEAARRLEERFGLRQVAVRDAATSRPEVKRGEYALAARRGEAVPDRVWLRGKVRAAAVGAGSESEWVANMRGAGVLVKPRVDATDPNRVTGYAVAKARGDGQTVWYGGSKLDGALSLPKVRQWRKWEAPSDAEQWRTLKPAAPGRVAAGGQTARGYRSAAARVDAVRRAMPSIAANPGDVQLIAGSTAEMMTRVAAVAEPRGHGPLTNATDALWRVAAPAKHAPAAAASGGGQALAGSLAAAAVMVAASGSGRNREQLAAMLTLVQATARLTKAIAQMRAASQRAAAAGAAHGAYGHLAQILTAGAAKGLRGQPVPPAPQGTQSRPRRRDDEHTRRDRGLGE